MNEDNYTCEICYENYDLKNENKLPKKMPCCNKTFCLSCLNDIYKRNNNQIKCPNCRKIISMAPKYLMDNKLIFSRFLICCNCHENVPQNQLYFYKNNNEVQIKCEKCEKGDMKLDDILPDFVYELKNNLKQYENCMKTDLIELIKKKIKLEITEYFGNILQNLIETMTEKILNNFNEILNLQKRQDEFKNMITQFSQNYKYLNAFIEDEATKNFDSKKILNCLIYYNDNISKIHNEFNFFQKNKIFLDKNCLICIKNNFNISKIEQCFTTIFEFNKNINIKDKKLISKNSFNLFEHEENDNNYNNDKFVKQLDNLIIKHKIDGSNNAPRI